MSNLFVLGDFISHSGKLLHWKIECDALSDADIETLAVMLAERLPPFRDVLGVYRGGLRLQTAMKRFVNPTAIHRLIVDDVLTTGITMEEVKEELDGYYKWDGIETIGAVLFARGPCPSWITPLFTLTPERED